MKSGLDHLVPPALKAIAAVAECSSVTKAAKRLGVTQPALSYQIKQLENAADVRLFERTRQGMTPTAAGNRLVRAARAVRAEIERAGHELDLLKSGADGRLRISSECFTAYHWLARVLVVFRETFPSVQVEVDVDVSRRPLEALQDGQLELLLTTQRPSDPRFEVTALFEDEMVAVMPPEHPLARRKYLSPRDFADQSVFVWNLERSDLFNLVLRPAGVRPRYAAEVPITEAMVEMVRSGIGISVLASWTVQPELDAGDLVSVRVTKKGIRRHWYGVWTERASTPAYVEHFLAVLTKLSKRTTVRRSPSSAT